MAWARLSELWLMLGEKEQARAAADKATSLAPNLARTQLVMGYAALSEYRDAEGSNQLYDDKNGTKTRRYGVGMDWRANRDLKTGAEFTHCDLYEPKLDFFAGNWFTEKRQEDVHRAYLYWTPSSRLAARTELVYDRYRSVSGMATEFNNLPKRL